MRWWVFRIETPRITLHERPYTPAWTVSDAVGELSAQSGRQFEPRIVEAFLAVVEAELLVSRRRPA